MASVDAVDKVLKLLRLGFDKGAQTGEAENAVLMASRIARKQSIFFEQVEYRIREMSTGSRRKQDFSDKPDGRERVNNWEWKGKFNPFTFLMPFGKHKGKTIMDLVENEPSYALWLIYDSDLSKDQTGFLYRLVKKTYFLFWEEVYGS
jgi:uncharacterized protein (DUF3820 family)